MTNEMIIDAYCRIRTIDQTIPDDVLDFMKDAAIEKLNESNDSSCKHTVDDLLYRNDNRAKCTCGAEWHFDN